ncbi:MAG: hypothetical protein ACM3ML_20930 [Micromonosporaceae bacterium]
MTMTAPDAHRATYREVLAERRFRLLFLSPSLAITADTLRMVALSVLVFALTGSPMLAAVTYGISFLPQAIDGTLLGTLADRVRPRLLITVGYGLETATATAVALALAGLPVVASLALVAAIACLTPMFGGASSRLIAVALEGDAYVLGRSLSNIASSAAQLLGLAAGGATVASLGARHALLVSAGCHLLAAAAIRLRLPDLPPAEEPPGQQPVSVLRHSWAVSSHLLTDPTVRVLLLVNWLPAAFVTGAESLIVPYAIGRGLPAGSPGLLLMLLAGVPLLGFAITPPLPVMAVLLMATGCGLAYPLGIQRRFLEAVLAPVLGQALVLLATGLMTLQGVGPAIIGSCAEVISPGSAMALAGAATAAAALALSPRVTGDQFLEVRGKAIHAGAGGVDVCVAENLSSHPQAGFAGVGGVVFHRVSLLVGCSGGENGVRLRSRYGPWPTAGGSAGEVRNQQVIDGVTCLNVGQMRGGQCRLAASMSPAQVTVAGSRSRNSGVNHWATTWARIEPVPCARIRAALPVHPSAGGSHAEVQQKASRLIRSGACLASHMPAMPPIDSPR